MEKEFVPYELAVELKELGFDEPCFGYYENGIFFFQFNSKQESELLLNCSTPTFSQAFRWFREKYNLLYNIVFFREDKRTKKGYWYEAYQWNPDMTKRTFINESLYFKTHEEAELACLKKLIEIVKNK